MKTMTFKDRPGAGCQLGVTLVEKGYNRKGLPVFGILRGSLVVADEIARVFSTTLNVIIARKLRAPHQPELGVGAIVNGDPIAINGERARNWFLKYFLPSA
jgi:putative phosphoribosyl transferase